MEASTEMSEENKVQINVKNENKIQTFVFLDIEATGLQGDVPRILELSMIAVSREDILAMKDTGKKGKSSSTDLSSPSRNQNTVPQLPRVLHKYTRLYYPRKLIKPNLEEITGLSNEGLHRLPGFSLASAEAIHLFLDLPPPLALVAHNGSRYDFPLLKAELNNVCPLEKFSNLCCVDTLKAIKDIDAVQLRESEMKEISEITMLAASFSFEDMDDEILEEAPAIKRTRNKELSEENVNQTLRGSSCLKELSSQVPEGNQRILEISAEPHMTPVKDHIPAQVTRTPETPDKLVKAPLPPVTPESSKACTPGTPSFNSQTFTETNKVRRSLTYDGHGKRKWDGTMPYRQVNIYRRLFNTTYQAHRAESDCQAMLQICGHYGDKFVQWADTFSENFADVKPMWCMRKTFRLS